MADRDYGQRRRTRDRDAQWHRRTGREERGVPNQTGGQEDHLWRKAVDDDRGSSDWRVHGPYSGMGPGGYRRSDERILDDVSERLTRHGQIDARQISAGVTEGEVILNGTVRTRREKRMAEEVAASVPGVVDVSNNLRVEQIVYDRGGVVPVQETNLSEQRTQTAIPSTGGSSAAVGRGLNSYAGVASPGNIVPGMNENQSTPDEARGEGMTPVQQPPSEDREVPPFEGARTSEIEDIDPAEDKPGSLGRRAAVGSGPIDLAGGRSASTMPDWSKEYPPAVPPEGGPGPKLPQAGPGLPESAAGASSKQETDDDVEEDRD